jgi:hypothetical protein
MTKQNKKQKMGDQYLFYFLVWQEKALKLKTSKKMGIKKTLLMQNH